MQKKKKELGESTWKAGYIYIQNRLNLHRKQVKST